MGEILCKYSSYYCWRQTKIGGKYLTTVSKFLSIYIGQLPKSFLSTTALKRRTPTIRTATDMARLISGEICPGCDSTEYELVEKCYKKDTAAIHVLRSHGVLPMSSKCPKCERDLLYYEQENMWRCNGSVKIPFSTKRNFCRYKISNYTGTFLENVHLAPWQVLLFSNSWVRKKFTHDDATENLGMTKITSVDWRSFCSEVTLNWQANLQQAIGGPGITVEIDETVIVKRKYKKGRKIKEIWIFGGIERESGKCFVIELLEGFNIEDMPKDERLKRLPRDKGTLLPIIQKFIRPGSIIYSDGWKAYNCLSENGYTHNTVIHETHYVNPLNPVVHTQTVERMWRDLKEWIKRPGMKSIYLHQYISRWLFARQRPKSRCLHDFLVEAGKLYQHGHRSTSTVPSTKPSTSTGTGAM